MCGKMKNHCCRRLKAEMMHQSLSQRNLSVNLSKFIYHQAVFEVCSRHHQNEKFLGTIAGVGSNYIAVQMNVKNEEFKKKEQGFRQNKTIRFIPFSSLVAIRIKGQKFTQEDFTESHEVADHLFKLGSNQAPSFLLPILNEQIEINEKLSSHIKRLYNQQSSQKEKTEDLSELINNLQKEQQLLSEQLNLLLESLLKGELNECLSSNYGTINKFLQSVPENSPVQQLFVNGQMIDVVRFLNLNSHKNVANFYDNNTVTTFDCDKIDGLKWGEATNEVD